MIAYTEKSTNELIQLLFSEEDRVTAEHIRELAARPDAIEPLREILRDEIYWYDGEHGEFWITMHAVTALATSRAEAALPEMIEAIENASLSDNDWVSEDLTAALAQFGAAAVLPLQNFISDHRGDFREDWKWSFARSTAAHALTRIAGENPETRAGTLDFLCGRLTDPAEDDVEFLSLIADHAVTVDRARGIAAVRIAYERDALDEKMIGDYESFLTGIDEFSGQREEDLTRDLFEFYQPEAIAKRQQRWKSEREAELKRFVTGPGSASDAGSEKARVMAELLTKIAALPEREQRLLIEDLRLPDDADDDFEEDSAQTDKDDYFIAEEAPITAPAGYIGTGKGSFVQTKKVGRNDPCSCGSGKKYKKCCGR